MSTIVVTDAMVPELCQKIRAAKELGIDTESDGPQLQGKKMLNVYRSHLVGVSVAVSTYLSAQPGRTDSSADLAGNFSSYYLPIAHRVGSNLSYAKQLQVREALEETQAVMWAHNWKHDFRVFAQEGWMFQPPKKAADSMVAAWLTGEDGTHRFGLKHLAKAHLGVDTKAFEDVFSGAGVGAVSPAEAAEYAGNDAAWTLELGQKFLSKLKEQDLLKWFWDTEMPFVFVLEEMERRGMLIDPARIGALEETLRTKVTAIQEEWDFLFPKVSITSGKQLQEFFFSNGYWDASLVGKTKTGAKVDKEAMEIFLANTKPGTLGHEGARLQLEYKASAKYLSTYTHTLVAAASQYPDRRLHPSFHQTGTVTGRLSCVRKGTLVEVVRDVSAYPRGIPIEDVRAGDLVYCYLSDGSLALRRVLKAWSNGRRELVRVSWVGQGRKHSGYVDLTPEHLVRLVSGEWRRADSLLPNDRILSLSRGQNMGYSRLWPTGSPEITKEHRFIFESVYGWLPEHVHHKNGNKLDNRVENLEGLTAAEHLSAHGTDTPAELREFRRQKMLKQWEAGSMPKIASGAKNFRWLGLTRPMVESLLRENRWSITLAARAGGYDFDTFKKYVVQEHGFVLSELKKLAREHRRQHYSTNHAVVSVEKLPGEDEVYDLMVEGAENFIAGELCVHNCSEPNLQNIPVRSAIGKKIKSCFIPSPGNVFVAADYSQIELRVLAHYSGGALSQAYIDGIDLHARNAKAVGCTRDGAKTIIFAKVYGAGVKKIAKQMGVKYGQAKKFIARLDQEFPEVVEVLDKMVETARVRGYARTLAHRRRYLPGLRLEEAERWSAERMAKNTPIQGTASDVMKVAMLKVAARLKEPWFAGAFMVGQVHDELTLECPLTMAPIVASMLKEEMENAFPLKVPLLAEPKIGYNWAECK